MARNKTRHESKVCTPGADKEPMLLVSRECDADNVPISDVFPGPESPGTPGEERGSIIPSLAEPKGPGYEAPEKIQGRTSLKMGTMSITLCAVSTSDCVHSQSSKPSLPSLPLPLLPKCTGGLFLILHLPPPRDPLLLKAFGILAPRF